MKWKVGSKGTIFYVHPGVIRSFHTSTIDARMHLKQEKTSSDVVDRSDFDERTIEAVLSFFYAGDYSPSPAARTLYLKVEHGAKEESRETVESEHVLTDASENGECSTYCHFQRGDY